MFSHHLPATARLQLHGATTLVRGSAGPCAPAVFVDGLRQNSTDHDWEDCLAVTTIETMEVYRSTTAPLEYESLNGSCGRVLIYARPERHVAPERALTGSVRRANT